ncbi:hypothetical protein [Paenibacillus sp. FSL W8-0194]|uniref:hypothetical protein n=1 Tax=Paenibacillus sp. FSL W8-0194 TaxID=2921711 RepID=UPI0030DC00A9
MASGEAMPRSGVPIHISTTAAARPTKVKSLHEGGSQIVTVVREGGSQNVTIVREGGSQNVTMVPEGGSQIVTVVREGGSPKCNGCDGAYFAQIVDLQILTDISELILQEYVAVSPELPK